MYTRQSEDHPIIILVFQNVDTPKYQCGTIQTPEGALLDTADTRRPRFSFFLTNNVKNQTKKPPSPDPTSLSNLAQHSHIKARETDI